MDTESGTRRLLRTTIRAAVVLASTATLVGTGVGWSLQHRLDADRVTSDAVDGAVAGAAFTALLVGLDARTDASGNPLPPEVLDALHAGPDEGQLHTDTIVLLHLPEVGPAVAISIPRDSFVPIAGGGTHKINSAYRRGLEDAQESLAAQGVAGPELDRRGREAGRRALVATVVALTGVRVDHFAEVNLAGFVELTDALRGVPVCLNGAVRDQYSGADLPAGPQTVSGPSALAFVRQRHGLEDGDIDRIARQQAFVAGLAQRLRDGRALADPDRLVGVLARHVVLDRGWDLDQALAQLRRLADDDLRFRTIPTGRLDLPTPVDGIAVEIDPSAVRAFVGGLVADADTTGPPISTTAPTAARPAAVSRTPPIPPTPPTPPTLRVVTADGIPCVD